MSTLYELPVATLRNKARILFSYEERNIGLHQSEMVGVGVLNGPVVLHCCGWPVVFIRCSFLGMVDELHIWYKDKHSSFHFSAY